MFSVPFAWYLGWRWGSPAGTKLSSGQRLGNAAIHRQADWAWHILPGGQLSKSWFLLASFTSSLMLFFSEHWKLHFQQKKSDLWWNFKPQAPSHIGMIPPSSSAIAHNPGSTCWQNGRGKRKTPHLWPWMWRHPSFTPLKYSKQVKESSQNSAAGQPNPRWQLPKRGTGVPQKRSIASSTSLGAADKYKKVTFLTPRG